MSLRKVSRAPGSVGTVAGSVGELWEDENEREEGKNTRAEAPGEHEEDRGEAGEVRGSLRPAIKQGDWPNDRGGTEPRILLWNRSLDRVHPKTLGRARLVIPLLQNRGGEQVVVN